MTDWLPPLLSINDFDGEWRRYFDAVYQAFQADFCGTRPDFMGKRMGLKRQPLLQDKESTYWHFITDGKVEDERQCDFDRCARIRWPRAMIERCPAGRPAEEDVVLWWKTVRNNEDRYVLALPDFSYIVILADRGEFVLPWTAYTVKEQHRRARLDREYEAYWEGIK